MLIVSDERESEAGPKHASVLSEDWRVSLDDDRAEEGHVGAAVDCRRVDRRQNDWGRNLLPLQSQLHWFVYNSFQFVWTFEEFN